jgi:hypothetical protein
VLDNRQPEKRHELVHRITAGVPADDLRTKLLARKAKVAGQRCLHRRELGRARRDRRRTDDTNRPARDRYVQLVG